MLSFGKILLLLAVGAVVWLGYRVHKRIENVRARHEDELNRLRSQALKPKAEMVECRRCGVYVAGTQPCERRDCLFLSR
ncbi:MAG: hypothetical protein ACKVSF_00815 [Alphaproteobacteria bacterium]